MNNKISTFGNLSEPDRMLFIAKLHHALWYNEDLFQKLEQHLKQIEKKLPEAKYFPPYPNNL